MIVREVPISKAQFLDPPRRLPANAPKRRINVDANGVSMGERLRAARIQVGMTQVELGEAAGFTSLDRLRCIEWERVKGNVQAHTVAQLAVALGVTMDWLWFGDQEQSA